MFCEEARIPHDDLKDKDSVQRENIRVILCGDSQVSGPLPPDRDLTLHGAGFNRIHS